MPAIVVSAYTAKATIIGKDPTDASTIFDHSSVLATVEKLFGLEPLTKRDAAANTLDTALNQENARDDALMKLPPPAADTAVHAPANPAEVFAAGPKAALSANQKTMSALALACDLKMSPKEVHAALISNHQKLVEQKDAADYINKVAEKVVRRRIPN